MDGVRVAPGVPCALRFGAEITCGVVEASDRWASCAWRIARALWDVPSVGDLQGMLSAPKSSAGVRPRLKFKGRQGGIYDPNTQKRVNSKCVIIQTILKFVRRR